jgi:hypothetical protein
LRFFAKNFALFAVKIFLNRKGREVFRKERKEDFSDSLKLKLQNQNAGK